MRKSFSLRLFGGCALEAPDGAVTGRAAQRRRLACLAAIAAAGRPGTSRDRLTALFWPDSSAEQGRHRLADTLSVLRGALGSDALVTAGERVAVNFDVLGCDVRQFEDALAAGDFASAAAVYAGPFLDGFPVPDAAEFEAWADGERVRLAREVARAFTGVAQQCAATGDSTGAAEWRRRVAALDPYSARAALHYMQALDAAGDRTGAIRHAAVHATLLREELGAEPSAEVLALAEQLRRPPERRCEVAAIAVSPEVPPPSSPGAAGLSGTTSAATTGAPVLAPVRARPTLRPRHVAGLALAAASVVLLAWHRTRVPSPSVVPLPPVATSAPTPPRAQRSRTPDPVADDFYLRGRHYWSLDTPAGIRRGVDYFWRAVDQDPTHALAYAGIADAYARLDDMSAMPAADARPRALAAARRAIVLDSTVAQAHAALAHILMHGQRWAEAEREYRAALALDPEYASAHLWYAVHLMAVGRVDDAVVEARRARALDPLSVAVNWLAGSILNNIGRHAEALAVLDGLLERVPGHAGLRYARATALVELGQYAEGAAEFERLGRPLGVARVRALQGRTAEAWRIVRAEEKRPTSATSATPPVSEHARRLTEFAVAYVALGAYDEALDWLEREVASGSNMIMGMKADTRLAPLRGHPRYVQLLRRLGVA